MRIHAGKRAIRALGVSESFTRTDRFSTLAGVVMRADLIVDGFVFGRAEVGGDDATSGIVKMHRLLNRDDINVIILSGAVISHYNVVDVDALAEKTGTPVICLTYKESSGLETSIRSRFENPEAKVAAYRKLGERKTLTLKTGKKVYARLASISEQDARRIVEAFAREGAFLEPVRVARLLARARHRD